jgi:hypothetical protein
MFFTCFSFFESSLTSLHTVSLPLEIVNIFKTIYQIILQYYMTRYLTLEVNNICSQRLVSYALAIKSFLFKNLAR